VRTYIPNFYGITTSPLHRGLPTDRLLAEWHLDSKRVIAAINDLAPDPCEAPAAIHIPGTPITGSASPPNAASHSSTSSNSVSEIQSNISSAFRHWFSKNHAAPSVRFPPSGADYLLYPWSDF